MVCKTNLQALEIHSEASRALPCCINHPWPVEGGLTPCLLTMDGTLPKQLKVKLIFVNEVWRCLREARPGFEQRETVLSQQMLLVLLHTHTHSGALLLHLIYCEGPTPPSAWCCHLRAEGAVSFCRHLVTTEPAQSKWLPCGHSSVTGLRKLVPFEVLLQFIVAKWFCLKQSTLYRALSALLVTHSQRKQ